MSVGKDLLDVPFGQMVLSLAMAIAEGQRALDRTSLETARALALERVRLVDEITEVIYYKPPVEARDRDGNVMTDENGNPIRVTGADVSYEPSFNDYTLLQAGLFPTFYQFTESIIEVKMSISSKTTSSTEFEAGASLGINYGPVSFAAHANFKTSQTYSYSVEGSSLLRTTLKPVPPPSRLTPRTITVNMLVAPPTVTVG
jgi:hypothetical protein